MGSFRRGIRMFRSQEVKIGSRPNCLGKTYPRENTKKYCPIFFVLTYFPIFFFVAARVNTRLGSSGGLIRITSTYPDPSGDESWPEPLPSAWGVPKNRIPYTPRSLDTSGERKKSPPIGPKKGIYRANKRCFPMFSVNCRVL